MCWSATVETGVLFIGRGVAYRKTGLHGILFISIVDPLQPPWATVDPPSTSSSLHLRLFIHGILFIGRGLAYRKTEETDLLRLKRGSC